MIRNLLILSSVVFLCLSLGLRFSVSAAIQSRLGESHSSSVLASHWLSLLFLPPLVLLLFFFALSLPLSLYSPFNLCCICGSICALQVLGWTDKHRLGFWGGGGVAACRGGGTEEKSGGLRGLSLVFHVVAVDCRSVCAYLSRVHICHSNNAGLCAVRAPFCCSVSAVDTAAEPQHHRCPQSVFSKSLF